LGVMVFAIYKNIEVSLIGIVLLFISITLIGIIMELMTSVSRKALQDDYQIQDLQEGMISAYNLYEREGEVYVDVKGFFQKIRESVNSGDVFRITAPRGKVLISSLAAGLTREDLDLLRKLSKEGKIGETFRIKKRGSLCSFHINRSFDISFHWRSGFNLHEFHKLDYIKVIIFGLCIIHDFETGLK